jgi:hypothetical protein
VGAKIDLLAARRGRIRKLEAVLDSPPAASFELSISESASPAANALRERWWQSHVTRSAK